MTALHSYRMQMAWLSWGLDRMMYCDLSWKAIFCQCTDRLLKFLINVHTNILPTPDNLRRWNLARDSVCGLCAQQNA